MSLEATAADAGYTLVNLAARGLHSSVYRADDANGSRVALKVFGETVSSNSLDARVSTLQTAPHDALLGFREVITLGDEAAVITDWFDGIPLADALVGPDPMPEVRAERIAAQILDGLAALHQAGVAHGAISDHNVLLDGDTPLLVDFALGQEGVPSVEDDIRSTAPVLRSLFTRTDLPTWRSAAFDRADVAGFADAAELKAAVLPSRRQRVRLEREENDEKPPLLLMVAVGLGAVLITIGAALFLAPDEEPLPEPTITGVDPGQ